MNKFHGFQEYLQSYPRFLNEFGMRRSVNHFFTALIVGFVAGGLGEMLSGTASKMMHGAVTELLSANLFVVCASLVMVMALGAEVFDKCPKILVFFQVTALWAGRLCFDVGAAIGGVMIGMTPILWLTGTSSSLGANLAQLSALLAFVLVAVRWSWKGAE